MLYGATSPCRPVRTGEVMHDVPPVTSARRYLVPQRVFVGILVVVLAALAWYLRQTLIPYVVGILVVALLAPLVRLVERHLPGRNLRPQTRRRTAALTV